jgi:hypothetical protein
MFCDILSCRHKNEGPEPFRDINTLMIGMGEGSITQTITKGKWAMALV